MSKILTYSSMSSWVIPYEDLLPYMHDDPDDLNEYYMNNDIVSDEKLLDESEDFERE